MVPLSEVVLSYLRNTDTATARQVESHDQQIAAAYWQQDVASIGARGSFNTLTQSYPQAQSVNTSFPCTQPAGSTPLLTLAWTRFSSSGSRTAVTVAYVTQSAGAQLVRLQCDGTTLQSTATLTHDLNATPTCSFDGAAFGSCAANTGTPSTISLKLSVSDPSGRGQPYTVTLDGQRRQT
jgi:hypothetical protein